MDALETVCKRDALTELSKSRAAVPQCCAEGLALPADLKPIPRLPRR